MNSFSQTNFIQICNELVTRDADLKSVIDRYGYPPRWNRPASFETLVHIILEQQVSLASALAAFSKLKSVLPQVTPVDFLGLSNETLQQCYFSRQKIIYTQHLATAMLSDELNLESLAQADNETVRIRLTKIKGIGNWTTDVYLMMVLQRSDLFPLGDIALMTSLREIKQLSADVSRAAIEEIAASWKPYRTIAAFILWHAYLSKRKKM